jgi:2-dehydro-3-deoxyphosphogluconate aldolase/(4S)-4-hydroxy-2-oxoglutarate aldolase
MNELLTKALQQKILPAVTIDDVDHALHVAEAFLHAGLHTMEITFRTDAAAKCVELISKKFPEMQLGTGTLLTVDYLQKAINAGAKFGLSSGLNVDVCKEAKAKNFPFIPAVMTPSEIETAYNLGYSILKLFPAAQIGGTAFLKAMLGPYEQLNLHFIPMGGTNPENMNDYLKMKNVIAVGGSWLATKDMIASKNYVAIETAVKEALHRISQL